jgi:hypothetical protein
MVQNYIDLKLVKMNEAKIQGKNFIFGRASSDMAIDRSKEAKIWTFLSMDDVS